MCLNVSGFLHDEFDGPPSARSHIRAEDEDAVIIAIDPQERIERQANTVMVELRNHGCHRTPVVPAQEEVLQVPVQLPAAP